MNLFDRIGDDNVPCGIASNVQRLENRHTTSHEGSESTGETGDAPFQLHRSKDRHKQLDPINEDSTGFGHAKSLPSRIEYRTADENNEPRVLNPATDPDDKLSDPRKRFIP